MAYRATINQRWRSRLMRFTGCPCGDPIQQEEGTGEKGENGVEGVADRMRFAVHGPKHLRAEQRASRDNHNTLPRNRPVKPAPPLEPCSFHNFLCLRLLLTNRNG